MTKALKTVSNGLLIFFEGIDGVGKTTQLLAAKQRLEAEGWLVKASRIHGGTPIGEALREVSFSELERPATTDLYISLAMHQALIDQVSQWRTEGAVILIDRSPLSIMAYQVRGDKLDAALGLRSSQESMRDFAPDLTILYTADVEKALARTKKKQDWADHFSSKSSDYFERCQQGYLELTKDMAVELIDANRSLDDVTKRTWQLISLKLK